MKNVIVTSFIFIFSLFFISEVKAATIEDYMEFGYYSNIGGKTFDNINQYYVINNGVSTTLTSKLVFDIYESIEYTPDKQDYFYFTLDYCSTGDSTIYDVYSTYENKIYGIFNTNQNCNSSRGTTGKIFKMFVKLKLSYIDTFDTDLKYSLYFTPSWGLNNKIGYNVFLRFLDMQVMTYDSFVDLYNQYSDKDLQHETNDKLEGIQGEQQETNDKLDEITDMDISDQDKEIPDDSSYQDYTEAEGDLMDKVNEADMDSLDIAIDTNSSNFVWNTITDIFNSHPMIMSTIIAILSIGIIKLALGR